LRAEVKKDLQDYEKVEEHHKKLIKKMENLYHDSPAKKRQSSAIESSIESNKK
jgi:hypothetical protein